MTTTKTHPAPTTNGSTNGTTHAPDPAATSGVGNASIGELVNNMPMKRWLLAGKRLGMTSQEIMEDPAASMVVAANEKAGRDTGNYDQYARFLDMGMVALSEWLGMDAGDAADKSDAAGE